MSWKVNPGVINSLLCPYFHEGWCNKLNDYCRKKDCPIKEEDSSVKTRTDIKNLEKNWIKGDDE